MIKQKALPNDNLMNLPIKISPISLAKAKQYIAIKILSGFEVKVNLPQPYLSAILNDTRNEIVETTSIPLSYIHISIYNKIISIPALQITNKLKYTIYEQTNTNQESTKNSIT